MPDSTPDTPAHNAECPETGQPQHFVRHIEEIDPGLWEVSTLTEDGHRLGGVGRTREEAIADAHRSAQVYGDYAYPTFENPYVGGRYRGRR
jgi:hypothetical protein